jgi:hypothetical protein
MLAEPQCVLLLYRAINTLGAQPDPDARYFVVASTWPTYARRYLDAYNADDETEVNWQPTPQDVSSYLEVLRWAYGLNRRQRRIMWYRADGCSLPMIADYLRTPIAEIEQDHADAVCLVTQAALREHNGWRGSIDNPLEMVSVSRRHHCA